MERVNKYARAHDITTEYSQLPLNPYPLVTAPGYAGYGL